MKRRKNTEIDSGDSSSDTDYELSQEDHKNNILKNLNKERGSKDIRLYENEMYLAFDPSMELDRNILVKDVKSFLNKNGFMFSEHLLPVKYDNSGQRYLSVRTSQS